MTIGKRIKELRDKLALSQEAFAQKIFRVKSTISQLERDKTELSPSLRMAICHTFNAREDWILLGEGEIFNQTGPPDGELPPTISSWDKELLDSCFTLKKIFDDKVHKKAIIENLHAFDLSIDDRKAKEELNKKLQESLKENEGVQNRISKLEKLCADIPDMKSKFEYLQIENRTLRTENNRLKSTYEAPDGSNGDPTILEKQDAQK